MSQLTFPSSCSRGGLRPLRPLQTKTVEDIRNAILEGHRRIIVGAPCGYGKTLLSAHIIDGALRKARRVVFTCPAITLVAQTVKAFEAEGIRDIGVMQAQHIRTDRNARVQVASVQTLLKREIPEVDLLILDECFPSGTMISTCRGKKPIESIEPGDLIPNANDTGRVLSLFKKMHRHFIRVGMSDGSILRCTPEHPIFTVSGWKEARLLAVGEGLFREQDLSRMRSDIQAVYHPARCSRGKTGIRVELQQERVLLELLCEENEEPYAHSQRARVGVIGSSEKRPQTKSAGRKREAFAVCSIRNSGHSRAGMDDGICRQDASQSGAGISPLLQIRLGESCVQDMHRTRRRKSLLADAERAGPKKGCFASLVRVESIEVEELPRAEPVYNLRVSGHPSYFANGFLVHNCHRHFKGLNELLDGPWQKKIAIGLSATPWVKGMGLRWTKLIIPATIPQLIDLGLLTSTKLYVPEEIANRQHIEVSNGQFVEESSAKEMSERRIVGNVVKTWKELGVPKTFLFAVNRDHAQQQMAAFIDGGIPWGYIDANTPQYERAIQFARMKRGENAGIASVGCLIAGVDEDVRCIIDCAPTKSEISLVQRWGRGIRTAEGKTALIGLDHAGNNTELGLGLFWEIHHDHLDTHKPGEKGVAYEGEPRPKKPRKCVICNALIEQGKAVCSACGEPVRSLGLEHEEGELVVYGTPKKAKSTEREYTAEEKRQWYGGMLWMAREGGKKDGLAWHAFFEKFGHYPAGYAKTAMEPTWEMEQWDRHRRIKWAKRRDKEAKSAERQETAAGDVRAELGAR